MKKLILFVSLSLLIGNIHAAEKANAKAQSSKKSSATEEPIAMVVSSEKPAVILSSDIDSVSYAIGIDLGNGYRDQLRQLFGENLNISLLLNAFEDAYLLKPTVIDSKAAGPIIQQAITKSQSKKYEESKKQNSDFLVANAANKDVIKLPSGLQYKILTAGNGAKPRASDQVKVHYEGRLIDGTMFDSSIERGQPATFGVTQVIAGWTEALQLMPVGSKWRLFIPYNLAYGEQGAGQQIPPFATLIFDVQLLDIIK